MKKFASIMALFVISILTFSMVSALSTSNLNWGTIKVNGDEVSDNEVLAVEEGQTLNIRVGLEAGLEDVKDVEVEAKISGLEHDTVYANSALTNIQATNTKYFNLELTLPKELEKGEYSLRLRVLDKNTPALEKEIMLSMEPPRHGIDIADVAFSPGNTVKAGRSLLTQVLLQNYGDKDEKDVRVTVAIPQLGIMATEHVDEVNTDNHNIDYEDVVEMLLSVPPTTAEGDYLVTVTASYNDFRDTVSKTYTLHVAPNELFQKPAEKLFLQVGPEVQTVAAGTTAKYGIALANQGVSSKAYTLEAVTGDWATASLSESLVVLEPGKSKVVYVDVTAAADAPQGTHTVSVAVKSGGEVKQTVALQANVVAGAASEGVGLRNGLEIALIVLVVLLVIVGLIIGFTRMRKDQDSEEQTYY